MSINRSPRTLTAFALVAATAAGVTTLWPSDPPGSVRMPLPRSSPARVATPPTPAPLEFQPLTEEQAAVTNAQIPFATTPLEAARPFRMDFAARPLALRTAGECLAAAIYYEAGYEPLQGMRAVAQTVLNRVRHPAFPNTVCGVVYEGAERRTGCQFTFTCDGSLARKPARIAWTRAHEVADAALNGYVEPSVGTATHYHANYVVPYWASSLDKIAAVGAHLFYKWRGSWGRRAAFTQIPRPDDSIALQPTIEYVFADGEFAQPPAAPLQSPIFADHAPKLAHSLQPLPTIRALPVLRADNAGGTLKADESGSSLRSETLSPAQAPAQAPIPHPAPHPAPAPALTPAPAPAPNASAP